MLVGLPFGIAVLGLWFQVRANLGVKQRRVSRLVLDAHRTTIAAVSSKVVSGNATDAGGAELGICLTFAEHTISPEVLTVLCQ